MNTLEFFRATLPGEGNYFLALIDKANGRVAHKSFAFLEAMAEAVETYSANPNVNVYHACAAYREPFVMVPDKKNPGELKRAYRDPSNWLGAKAFWIDIDCGDEKAAKGDGYPTKRDAATAVVEFCANTEFPKPMFVDSGNGVHCYWPLTKTIKPEAWVKMAHALKAVLNHFGVLADPTCTADLSRILRPVGGLNRKSDEPKPVIAKNAIEPIEPSLIASRLMALVNAFELTPIAPPKAVVEDDLNDDLTAHLPPKIPSYAEIAANECKQLADMRDTQGDVNYEHWRGVIGVIYHCEEGIELAHKWSARREETGHAQNDVDTKFNTWSAGPTTCEFFSRCNPDGCAGCIHKGKVTSPIILGRKPAESEEQFQDAVVEGEEVAVYVPKFPDNYKYENGFMTRYMQDKDGIWHAHAFCADMFYPIHRIRKENGQFCFRIRMHLPDKRIRDFDIDTNVLSSTSDCTRALAANELLQTNHKDAHTHMTAYLRAAIDKLKREAEELNTMVTFGWRDNMDAFLIGDRLYHSDGTTRKVLTGGYAQANIGSFPAPKGTVEGYAKAVNHLYARKGMEPFQYAMASAFGSVLTPMGESLYKGLMLVLSSAKPGKGKTTVCHAALYAFGDAHEMTLGGEKGSTVNARWARMGAYQNISMLIDEITNIKADEVSRLAYAISMGSEPERMTTAGGKGVTKAHRATWALSLFVTCNKDMYSFLGSMQQNTEAEAVRFLQIKLDDYDTKQFEEGEVSIYMNQIERNQGKAGELFVKHVVTNYDDTAERVLYYFKHLTKAVPGAEYRFYRNHAACTLAAAELMVNLGIWDIDMEALTLYAQELLVQSCENVVQNNAIDPEDALNVMINDMLPRLIITDDFRDGRDGRMPETVDRAIVSPVGRYVRTHPVTTNTKSEHAGKMFIAKKEVRDWCVKNRIDEKTMLDYAESIGALASRSEKITIGRGTNLSAGNMRCYEFDMKKIEARAANPSTGKFVLHSGGAGTEEESLVQSAR